MAAIDPVDLKVGVYIPNGDGLMSPVAHRWSDISEHATAIEHAGFDSVWVADHMVFKHDDLPTEGRWECWTVLAAIAAKTSRVEIGPLVTCIGFRNPALLAKMAETVDEISDGRLILGLGAGWHEPEFTTYGFPFDHRASRFEEGFAILEPLVRKGEVDFSGQFESAPGCELRPRGPRNGTMPIMIGTDGPRLLKTAAKSADIWNTTWVRSADELLPRLDALDQACDAAGRDRSSIGRTACIFLDVYGAEGVWFHEGTSAPNPMSIEEGADYLATYAAVGIDHVMLWIDPGTVAGIERAARMVEALRSR